MHRLPWLAPALICVLPLSGAEACKMESGKKEIKLNTAQCYAHQLAKLTSDYLGALESQVSAQEDMYGRLAALYNSAQRENADLGLDIVRDSQVQLWINQLADGTQTVSSVLEDAARLANSQFTATRAEYEQEMDGKAAYLATLNNLEADTKKVAGLVSLFNDMAQSPDVKTWVADLATYGEGVHTDLQQAGCALAKSRLTFFDSDSTRLKASLAKPGLSPAERKLCTARKEEADKQVQALQQQASACETPEQPKQEKR